MPKIIFRPNPSPPPFVPPEPPGPEPTIQFVDSPIMKFSYPFSGNDYYIQLITDATEDMTFASEGVFYIFDEDKTLVDTLILKDFILHNPDHSVYYLTHDSNVWNKIWSNARNGLVNVKFAFNNIEEIQYFMQLNN